MNIRELVSPRKTWSACRSGSRSCAPGQPVLVERWLAPQGRDARSRSRSAPSAWTRSACRASSATSRSASAPRKSCGTRSRSSTRRSNRPPTASWWSISRAGSPASTAGSSRCGAFPTDVVASRDDNRALAFVLDQLKEPRRVPRQGARALRRRREAESFDVLEFKDGRVFERYSKPQRIGGESVGPGVELPRRHRAARARRGRCARARSSCGRRRRWRRSAGSRAAWRTTSTTCSPRSSATASLLLEQLPRGDPGRQAAEEIEKAAERAAGLTRQLLAFSRKQMLELKVLDLNTVVADMHNMLERLIGEHIELVDASRRPTWAGCAVDPEPDRAGDPEPGGERARRHARRREADRRDRQRRGRRQLPAAACRSSIPAAT